MPVGAARGVPGVAGTVLAPYGAAGTAVGGYAGVNGVGASSDAVRPAAAAAAAAAAYAANRSPAVVTTPSSATAARKSSKSGSANGSRPQYGRDDVRYFRDTSCT